MTYEQFLEALGKLKDKRWEIFPGGNIRCTDFFERGTRIEYGIGYDFCPICAVQGFEHTNSGFIEAAEELNMDKDLAQDIAHAADMAESAWLERKIKDMRKDLLRVLGLKERS
jgi:hypothetical protein